jgi:hypothetical protein
LKNRQVILLGIILTFLFVVKAKPVLADITYNERVKLEQIAINIETYGREIHNRGCVEYSSTTRPPNRTTPLGQFLSRVIVPQTDINFVCDLYFREEINQPMFRSIDVPSQGVHVIGDLHGQLVPTIRQIKAAKQDGAVALLTGDLKDRGYHSLEVMIYAYVQRLLNPSRVFILLGNHDCGAQSHTTLEAMLYCKYTEANDDLILNNINAKVVPCLPWAAELISHDGLQKYFCAHAGIGPTLQNQFNVLRNLRAPIDLWRDYETNTQYHQLDNHEGRLLNELTWSDPHNGASFTPNSRGAGYYFNAMDFHNFCTTHGFKGMIAAHRHTGHYAQLTNLLGVNAAGEFGADCLQKFYSTLGAPNIHGSNTNNAAFVILHEDMSIEAIAYDSLTATARYSVTPTLTSLTPPPASTTSSSSVPPVRVQPVQPSSQTATVSKPAVQPKWTTTPVPVSVYLDLPKPASSTVYRVYNPNDGFHHYTMDKGEVDNLVNLGWRNEDSAFGCSDEGNGNPVYRVYNPNSGIHHFTMNENEKNHLVSLGWQDEGIAWHAFLNGSTPVYRMYNPGNGEHCWTINRFEVENAVAYGWIDEEIAWYMQ